MESSCCDTVAHGELFLNMPSGLHCFCSVTMVQTMCLRHCTWSIVEEQIRSTLSPLCRRAGVSTAPERCGSARRARASWQSRTVAGAFWKTPSMTLHTLPWLAAALGIGYVQQPNDCRQEH